MNKYKQGQLIAVNGEIYEYCRFDDVAKVHLMAEVGIDCEGILTLTHIMCYFYPQQLAEASDEIHLTDKQWYGVVEHFIRQETDLSEEEITNVAEDIVDRCFSYGIPKINELADYIAEYMNR